MNGYSSTKLCPSEFSSPIKMWRNTKMTLLSAKDFSDVSSDELTVISSVSSSSISSHRKNNRQSDHIIHGK